ncbi:MAG: hypothetical protein OSB69_18340, partial [Alphaproteobacteria bacterium]|nr:hypothetical protein [Alphaproteobacteria bacterium]
MGGRGDQLATGRGVHLCFGNSGGQRIQFGGWDGLMNYPNSLHVAHIVIECRNWPGDGLAV